MFRKIPFICESLTTFVALERLLSRVHPHVTLQMIRSSASVIPLVTHEWLFSSAQCPRCQLGIALNRARSDQSQIVGFVV